MNVPSFPGFPPSSVIQKVQSTMELIVLMPRSFLEQFGKTNRMIISVQGIRFRIFFSPIDRSSSECTVLLSYQMPVNIMQLLQLYDVLKPLTQGNLDLLHQLFNGLQRHLRAFDASTSTGPTPPAKHHPYRKVNREETYSKGNSEAAGGTPTTLLGFNGGFSKTMNPGTKPWAQENNRPIYIKGSNCETDTSLQSFCLPSQIQPHFPFTSGGQQNRFEIKNNKWFAGHSTGPNNLAEELNEDNAKYINFIQQDKFTSPKYIPAVNSMVNPVASHKGSYTSIQENPTTENYSSIMNNTVASINASSAPFPALFDKIKIEDMNWNMDNAQSSAIHHSYFGNIHQWGQTHDQYSSTSSNFAPTSLQSQLFNNSSNFNISSLEKSINGITNTGMSDKGSFYNKSHIFPSFDRYLTNEIQLPPPYPGTNTEKRNMDRAFSGTIENSAGGSTQINNGSTRLPVLQPSPVLQSQNELLMQKGLLDSGIEIKNEPIFIEDDEEGDYLLNLDDADSNDSRLLEIDETARSSAGGDHTDPRI